MEQSAVSVTNLSDQLPFHAASDGGGTPSDGAQPHLTSAVPNADTRDNSVPCSLSSCCGDVEGTLTHLSPARSIQHVGVDGVEIQPCEPHSDISPSPSNGVPVEHDFLSDDPQVVEHEVPTGDPVELDQSVPENKRTSTLLEVLRDAETRVEPNSTSSLTTTVSNTVIIDLTLDSDEEEEEALRSAMRLEALLPQVSPSQKREAFDSSLESLSRQPLGSASAHTPDGTPELCATGKSKEPSIVKNHRSSSMQELLNIRKKLTNPSALATQPNDLPSEPLRHSIPSAPVAQLPIDNAVPLSTATSALPAMASATDLKAGLPECPPVVPQVYREEVCTNVTSRHFNSQSSTPAIPVGPTAQFEPLEVRRPISFHSVSTHYPEQRDEPMQIEDPGRSHREMVAAAPVTLETFPQDGEDEDVDDSYEIQPLGRRRHVARQRESSDSNDELWELMYPESTDAEVRVSKTSSALFLIPF
ncbi:hypothetical protein JAAARDRAFT_267350 [Jaapia argillacea MUCL 33604]|uniref:Uncharacterized protein n=1 Tax=Jaapia argillacea MUCL 33604 TaxID=933084 RepID=A0A067PRT9_9AGAM|nr:hypothetical protein JAAARDRAFT_267350 [Jaapia argillacea MUCL 33604]